MHTSTPFAVLAATLISSASAGVYYVDNLCPFPLYLKSTSQPTQPTPPPLITLQSNTTNSYSEVMRDAGKLSLPLRHRLSAVPPAARHHVLVSPIHHLSSSISSCPILTSTVPRLHPQCPYHLPHARHGLTHASHLPPNHDRHSPRLQLLRHVNHLWRPAPSAGLRAPRPTRRLRPQLPAARPGPGLSIYVLAGESERGECCVVSA